ncbi:Choline-phosphate cytidylyltransferase B [Echinococcus granulosus]|nr:Choline-phosphate cytidylyltransferase B [Echinococcus granulosus]
MPQQHRFGGVNDQGGWGTAVTSQLKQNGLAEDQEKREMRHPAPFSHEPAALRALEECDYSTKITLQMAKSGKAPRRVRVYADGVYDMFHSGHARQLMQASNAIPNTYLIVGVTSDADTLFHKGQTVMNERERYEAVRHCRYVDEVIVAAPWECTIDFLRLHKIDFIAHDDIPYAGDRLNDIYQPFKDAGMFLTTQRSEGISTTDVIARILKDYDVYLRRNISRGLTRHDLNISYVKEKQLLLENNIQTIVERGSHFLGDFGSRRRRIVAGLEDLYQEFSASFVRFFGTQGLLRHWLSDTTAAIRGVVSPHASASLPPSLLSDYDANSNAADRDSTRNSDRSTGRSGKRPPFKSDDSILDSASRKRSRR